MDDYVVPPMTQGQKKTRQRLKELFDNEVFKSELADILAMPNKNKKNKQLWKLAYKYRLEYEMGRPLLDIIMGMDPGLDKQIGHELDVCQLYDEEDHYLNEQFPVDFQIPPSKHPGTRAQIKAFPVHIGISIHSTKRDVLDFVNKRWDYIRYMLDCFTNDRPGITRVKPKAKRDDFIWENRDAPSKALADKVNLVFPDENLTYADINSILYYLRQRKFSNLV
mgnify:FL=1